MIEVKRLANFNSSKEKIWQIITNNAEYAWRSDLSKIEMVDDVHFIEYAKNDFTTNFYITKKEPYTRYEFDMVNANLKGHWIGNIQEIEKGTIQVEFIEQIEVSNIIMKLLAKIYLKKQQSQYIEDLKKRLEKE